MTIFGKFMRPFRYCIGFPLMLIGIFALIADGSSLVLALLGTSLPSELRQEELWIGVPVDLLLMLVGSGLFFGPTWWLPVGSKCDTVNEFERRADRKQRRSAVCGSLGFLLLYVLSTGPMSWIVWHVAVSNSGGRVIQWSYLPLRWMFLKSNFFMKPLTTYTRFWLEESVSPKTQLQSFFYGETPRPLSALAGVLLGAWLIFVVVRWLNRRDAARSPVPHTTDIER